MRFSTRNQLFADVLTKHSRWANHYTMQAFNCPSIRTCCVAPGADVREYKWHTDTAASSTRCCTHACRCSQSNEQHPVPAHAAQEALEQELREGAAKGHLQLDDAGREEYNRIKQDAGAKTSKLAQDLASLQTTQKARNCLPGAW